MGDKLPLELPKAVQVLERTEGLRIEFPRRELAKVVWPALGLLGAGSAVIAGGALWARVAWEAFLREPAAGLMGILALAVVYGGIRMARYGVALLVGRAVIEVRGDRLRARERVGPLEWGRSRPLARLRSLTLKPGSPQSVHAWFEGEGSALMLAPGYSSDWLEPAARALADRVPDRRIEVVVERPARALPAEPSRALVERPASSRARVERGAGVMRLTLPPPGLRPGRAQLVLGAGLVAGPGLAAFAIGWGFHFLGGAAAWLLPILWILAGVMGLALSLGLYFVLEALRNARRRAQIEIRDGRLTLGRESWALQEIAAIRSGDSGTRVDDEAVRQLDVHLRDGRQVGRLAGREPLELDWIAGLLGRELQKAEGMDVAPAEHAPGGTCAVCGAGMGSAVVFCARCGTPHHEDCWNYAGRCSTYGCLEARALPAPPGGG